jgi:hypothetical protein
MNPEWTLLAPGPTLQFLDPDRFRPLGPVVAINVAKLAPVHVDFWCCQDPAYKFSQVFDKMDQKERREGPLIWCRENQAETWNDLGFRVMPHLPDEHGFQTAYVQKPEKMAYASLTIFTALTLMIHRGAKRIVVYGCDMSGLGYGYGTDIQKRPDDSWVRRWNNERTQMRIACESWKRNQSIQIDFKEKC